MKLGTTDISAIKLGGTDISKAYLGNSVVYESGPDYSEPFYIEDISGSSNTVTIKTNGSSTPALTIYKSTDKVNWTSMGTTSKTGITASVPANGKLYLRCSTNAWGSSSYYATISCSSRFNVGGNIMSLLYGSSFTGEETAFPSVTNYALSYLFKDATTLVSAENLLLPATTLANYCYYYLFQGCTSLTTAPALPATSLAPYCYRNMFTGCTSLTTAPALQATTLADHCYRSLFQGCTSLTTAPELPATTLTSYCYSGMFNGCSSLTTAPELPATTLTYSCYDNMFYNCTSLTTAPELPATTLASYCYNIMFNGCSSLNYIKVGFTAWPNLNSSSASNYRATYQWTKLTRNTTGTFVCPSALSQQFNASGNNATGTSIAGYSNAIPYGWTVQTY